MRRKTPQNVFLGAQFSKIQPGRIDVLNPTQSPFTDHLLQFYDRRVILKDVSDHQNALPLFRKPHEFAPFTRVQREWFFNKDIFAVQKTFLYEFEMLHCWSSDDHAANHWIFE